MPPARVPRNLQDQILEADGVVLVDRPLTLDGEDQIQVAVPAGDKSAAFLRRRYLEALIELGDVLFTQKAIGLPDGAQAAQPQLLRESSLPGTEVTLSAPSCLGRVGRDHLHAQVMNIRACKS